MRRHRHLNKTQPTQFATAGNERAAPRNPHPDRDPNTLTDFDPSYGKTTSAQAQPGHGAESGFGKSYGQGFGVGAGRGVESSSSGLEGAGNRERDYRGNAGTTFGAVVGPDALKDDTREDDRRRPDPKPEP
jgi:hypothetical protein